MGRWNDFHMPPINNNILFRKDSITVTSDCRKLVGTWKADNSNIYICYNIKYKNTDFTEYDTIAYRLSKFKDSLYTINKIPEYEHLLLKVKDDWEHYSKRIGFKIDLPKTNEKMIERDSVDFYPNIFIGMDYQKIKVRHGISDYKKNKLTPSDYARHIIFKYNIYKNHDKITLIVDKNVLEYKVDSIKQIIRDLKIPDIKFFRVYQYKIAKYGYERLEECELVTKWNWWGLYED
jgi:hypothetical protein